MSIEQYLLILSGAMMFTAGVMAGALGNELLSWWLDRR
jgi:hypothetical protein